MKSIPSGLNALDNKMLLSYSKGRIETSTRPSADLALTQTGNADPMSTVRRLAESGTIL
jgi:hypothetical protein